MDEFSRRAFGSLLAASSGMFAGCSLGYQGTDGGGRVQDGSHTVVTTRRELQQAFADLSAGDTLFISAENAPYRTTEWLDVDVDGVTILGPGVPNLVEPAGGANVGGIRIGERGECRGVTVQGFGFDGNRAGQSSNAARLHGVTVANATNVVVDGCRIRNTSPQRHGDGGSGVSVGRRCSNVRISNNRIRDYGDRGVQVGGNRIGIAGNLVTNGLDRAVAADLWEMDGQNFTAQRVSVVGNVLGDSVEGSLVGIARNDPAKANQGYLSVVGNVGFGSHKSFCHVRGPERFSDVSIQNNVSRQQAAGLHTDVQKYAGVAVDPAGGHRLSVRNNEFYDYSGHGVEVNGDVRNVSVQGNAVSGTGLAGIRLVGARRGLVEGNRIDETETTGVYLRDATEVAVHDNYVQGAGTVGIRSDSATGRTGNDIAHNYVVGNGRRADVGQAAIRVEDRSVRVRGNAIRQNGGPAVVVGGDAGENVVEGNWADGRRPWRIASPTTRAWGNTPAVDVHRDLSPEGGDRTVSVQFDRPYAAAPKVSFGRGRTVVADESYRTDGDGNFVGASFRLSQSDAVLDVFVDGA